MFLNDSLLIGPSLVCNCCVFFSLFFYFFYLVCKCHCIVSCHIGLFMHVCCLNFNKVLVSVSVSQFWHVGSCVGRNQSCQISTRSVRGFGPPGGRKSLSPIDWSIALTLTCYTVMLGYYDVRAKKSASTPHHRYSIHTIVHIWPWALTSDLEYLFSNSSHKMNVWLAVWRSG